jgi:hypothetical protein
MTRINPAVLALPVVVILTRMVVEDPMVLEQRV